MDEGEDTTGAGDPRIHRSPDDTDINLTDATLALHDWEEEEEREREAAISARAKFEGLQIDPDIDFYPEVADREPGDRNIVRAGFDIHPQVTLWSAGFLAVFISLSLIFSERTSDVFNEILNFINEKLGWLYILDFNIFVGVALFFALSRYGKIRLGGPFARPEFSTVSWYAMLLSAGLGIGLMFWGVAEPIFHLSSPPPLFGVEANTGAAAKAAMATTYLHWGIHGWSLYALVALALGFFAYNRGLPLTFRSIFYPILGPKIYGNWGNAIDTLTVVATLFGLATSLGFGAGQASAGLNKLFGTPDNTAFQVLLIAAITGLATISVVAGLDAGVKRLSELNIWLAAAFDVVYSFAVHPELGLLRAGLAGVRFLERGLLRHLLAGGLDDLLLGLVDLVVSVRGDVHSPNLQRAFRAGTAHGSHLPADDLVLLVDGRLRRSSDRPATQRRTRCGIGCQ